MSRRRLATSDVLLALAGLIGLMLGLWLLPRQHPDAVLQHMLSAEAARHRALTFLAQQGYRVDTTHVIVVLQRASELLRRWQMQWGRPELVRRLKDLLWLPGYRWVVSRLSGEMNGQRWQVVLAGDGTIWGFRGPEMPGEDPAARAAAGIAAEAFDPLASWGKLSGVPDLSETPKRPGPKAAIALAHYHLQRTIGSVLSLRPDSVGLLAATGSTQQAVVRFRGPSPMGDSVTVQVVVAASGQLRSLEARWGTLRLPEPSPLEEGPSRQGQDGFTVHEVQDLLSVLLFIGVGIWLLTVFLRRLHRRLLDTQAPLRDAMLGGLVFAVATLGGALPGMLQVSDLWLRVLILLVSTLVLGVFGAASVFLLAGTSDALARDRWPDKLAVLTLLRNGQVRNVVVGGSLLRGMALGGLLLGMTASLLWLWPRVALRLDADAWTIPWPGMQLAVWLGLSVWVGMLLVYLLLAVMVRLPWRDGGRAVGALTLLLLLVGVSAIDLEQVGFELIAHACWGVVLAWACWRYEPVCSGVGAVTAWLLWRSVPGWMAVDGPFGLDGWIVLGILGAGLVIGFVGIQSRRSAAELPRYVPAYLQELARQERLERELEIARQAQASLLPRTLPEVPGIAMAALCQPAYEVGGDYYDIFSLPDGRLAVVVGDVSGKGIQAAFFMTLIKGHVRALSLSVRDPADVLRHLNRLFREQAPRGLFVTMIYGVLDPEARTLTLARAGHPPVLHYQACVQQVQCLRPSGMGIGLADAELFNNALENCVLRLRAGDRILLYTDGLTEIAGAAGARWGTERLQQWLLENSFRGDAPEQALDALKEQLRAFAGTTEPADDLTAILVEVK